MSYFFSVCGPAAVIMPHDSADVDTSRGLRVGFHSCWTAAPRTVYRLSGRCFSTTIRMLSDRFSASSASSGDVVVPVSALNRAIASMLERTFPLAWISGEVSNFTRAASGHWYFSIKDAQAQIRCVMFRGRAQYAEFTPREGDRIEVRALVTMYEPRGELQLNVEAVRRTGQGRLYEAFLRLKAQLEAEGLFDPERKRALPSHPRAIGVITSMQAAALRDVLTTGMALAAIARASVSSLNDHKSSMDPPPRHSTSTSTSLRAFAVSSIAVSFSAEPAPCTGAG